jgi:sphinganine-1-phosphate aldolase
VAPLLAGLPPLEAVPDSQAAWALLQGFGIGGDGGGLPEKLAPLLAVIETLPPPIAERLLIELIARLVEPR